MNSIDGLCQILINLLFSSKNGVLSDEQSKQLNQVLDIIVKDLNLSPYDLVGIIDADDLIATKAHKMSNKNLNVWLSSANEMLGILSNDKDGFKVKTLYILLSYIDNRVVRIIMSRLSDNLRYKIQCSQRKLTDQTLKFNRVNYSLKKSRSKINEHLKHVKNTITHHSNIVRNRIYSDFVSILGIFTAITFATFGGLQLLGHVFNGVGKLTHIGFGKTISISAVFLFGVYLILLILFNGISRLTYTRNRYTFSPSLNIYLISGFSVIFILGIIISYVDVGQIHIKYLCFIIMGLVVISLLIIMNVSILAYRHRKQVYSNFHKILNRIKRWFIYE